MKHHRKEQCAYACWLTAVLLIWWAAGTFFPGHALKSFLYGAVILEVFILPALQRKLDFPDGRERYMFSFWLGFLMIPFVVSYIVKTSVPAGEGILLCFALVYGAVFWSALFRLIPGLYSVAVGAGLLLPLLGGALLIGTDWGRYIFPISPFGWTFSIIHGGTAIVLWPFYAFQILMIFILLLKGAGNE